MVVGVVVVVVEEVVTGMVPTTASYTSVKGNVMYAVI